MEKEKEEEDWHGLTVLHCSAGVLASGDPVTL
jgi:hypothetical protein